MTNPLRKLATIAALILCSTGLVLAQGVRKDDFVINQAGKPIPNASVFICTRTATGAPCTPLATVYSDEAETMPITQPILTGPIGNFGFYATPGDYVYSVTGSTINPTTGFYTLPCTPTASPSGCGSGGGGAANGVTGNIQVNSSGAFLGAAGINSEDGNNLRIKGPDPLVDVTVFGARSFTGGIPQTTATCQSGSPNVTLASNNSPAGFGIINGDGITIYGCGATNVLSTPSAPTVTPATTSGETTTGWYANIPAGVAGATTACYKVAARDLFGGITAASSGTCTSTGQATLGLEVDNISTITRANDVITVTTTGNNHVGQGTPANSGTMVHIVVAAGNQMNGWYAVCSVTNATTFTICNTTIDTRSQGSSSGDTYNAATGTVSYYVENHISIPVVAGAYEYLVYYSTSSGGTYNLIGTTHPQGISNGYQDLQFADYGATFLAGQRFPTYYPTTAPSSATNDMLTSTVVSGGTTTSLVLANNAGQNASGQFATYDAAPGIVAAAKFADYTTNGALTMGYVYIPGNSAIVALAGNGLYYPTFSPMIIPQQTTIVGTGTILANEPIILQGSTTWSGLSGGFGTDQFGWGSWEAFGQQTSDQPVFILKGVGNHLDHMQINNNLTNGGHGVLIDNADATTINYFDFGSGQSVSDTLSIPLIIRDTTQTITKVGLDHVAFDMGPNQVNDKSWTPAIWQAPGEDGAGNSGLVNIYLTASNILLNRRGMYVSNSFPAGTSNGPSFTDINFIYRQGGITPTYAAQFGTTQSVTTMHNVSMDTENNPLFACINPNSVCGTLDISMTTGGNVESLIEGARSASVRISLYGPSGSQYQSQLQNRDSNHQGIARAVTSPFQTSGSYLPGNVDLMTFFEPVHIIGGQSLYFDMPAPTSVSGSVVATGSVPVASPIYYAVSAVGTDGGETIVSLPSNAITTTSGNQTVNLTWGASNGAVSYNIYRCVIGASCLFNGVINTGALSGGLSAWNRMALHSAGTTYSDSAASSTQIQPPFVTGTGSTIVNNTGITTNNLTVNGTCTGCPGGIGGTIATNQIAAGSGANTVHGFAGFTFDGTTHKTPNVSFTETTAPSAAAGQDICYGDSTAHAIECANNNGSFLKLAPVSGAITPGDCVQFGVGPTLVDATAACGGGGGGLNTAMSNISGPAVNTTILPGAVNTAAIGSNALSFTNFFVGTVANQTGSFDTSNLTANRVMKFPDAASTAVRNCAAVSHQWITQILQSTGACTLAQPAIGDISGITFSGSTTELGTVSGAVTSGHVATWDASGNLIDGGTAVSASSTNTFTNKTTNVESTGNVFSEPIKAFFAAGGCSNSTAAPGFDIGTTNQPTPQCAGTTVPKGVLQFARSNVAYINWHLPPDWNSSAATDIELGFTTTDTTNGHITSFNIQTGCNKQDGTVTDDPSLNALQALSVTTGASQVSGGMLTGTKTSLTMTGCAADYNFEIAITRNNSGTDTNTDTAVAVKFAEITTGVTKNAANR